MRAKQRRPSLLGHLHALTVRWANRPVHRATTWTVELIAGQARASRWPHDHHAAALGTEISRTACFAPLVARLAGRASTRVGQSQQTLARNRFATVVAAPGHAPGFVVFLVLLVHRPHVHSLGAAPRAAELVGRRTKQFAQQLWLGRHVVADHPHAAQPVEHGHRTTGRSVRTLGTRKVGNVRHEIEVSWFRAASAKPAGSFRVVAGLRSHRAVSGIILWVLPPSNPCWTNHKRFRSEEHTSELQSH